MNGQQADVVAENGAELGSTHHPAGGRFCDMHRIAAKVIGAILIGAEA